MFIYKDKVSKDIISLLTDMRVFYILTNQTGDKEAELTEMYNTLKNHSLSNGLILTSHSKISFKILFCSFSISSILLVIATNIPL